MNDEPYFIDWDKYRVLWTELPEIFKMREGFYPIYKVVPGETIVLDRFGVRSVEDPKITEAIDRMELEMMGIRNE